VNHERSIHNAGAWWLLFGLLAVLRCYRYRTRATLLTNARNPEDR
jgi:hypothetical protein